ncbi:hypothetical protein V8E53_000288 [Lactarius tabidus]
MPGSPVIDIRNSFGAAFIGLLVSTALFGLTVVQTWIYYWNYGKRDSKPLTYFVAFVTVMDATHTFLCTYAIYWYLILNFGNVESLEYCMWAMDSQVPVATTVNAALQLVAIMQNEFTEPSLLELGFVHGNGRRRCGRLVDRCVDVLVSLPQEDRLREASHLIEIYAVLTFIHRTDSIITTLMAYSVNSGLLTAILAGASATMFLVSRTSLIWMAVNWVMYKCYVNSLLAMLNSRDHLRDRPASRSNHDKGVNMSSFRIDNAYGTKPEPAGVSVTVHRSTTSNFAWNKSDHDVEPAFEVLKPDASIGPPEAHGQTSVSSV